MRGLRQLEYKREVICYACQYKKKVKISFQAKNQVSTNQALLLFHIDLFSVIHVSSLNGNRYAFFIINDSTKFTWVLFLTHKDEALGAFSKFYERIHKEKGCLISKIRSDHSVVFKNCAFKVLWIKKMF